MSFLSPNAQWYLTLFAIVIPLVHKLLFDTLGTKYFPENSVYSWFPMTLPQTMRTSFANDLVPTKDWTFDRPSAAK